MPRFLGAARFLDKALTAVIMTDDFNNPHYCALYRHLAQDPNPDLLLMPILKSDFSVAHDHPAYGKTMLDGIPTVYLCTAGSCLAPITTIQALKDQLSRLNLMTS